MRTQAIGFTIDIGLLCPFAAAQWVQTNLQGIGVTCLTISGTNLFAGSYGGCVFLSARSGVDWHSSSHGMLLCHLPTHTEGYYIVNSLATSSEGL